MNHDSSLSELEAFARKRIAAHRYADDFHFFTPYKCDTCGIVPFELTVEHHSGSKKGDFKGVIFGLCTECGGKKRLFSFTGKHRERTREEKPKCTCGNEYYVVGECERIEREEGIMGFFDEGVVVGMCSRCGRKRAIVYTD